MEHTFPPEIPKNSIFQWDFTFLALLLAGHGGFNLYRP